MAMEAYAGLAVICYRQGDIAVAKAWIDSILTFIANGNPLEGFTETSWIYYVCYFVLQRIGDKKEAGLLLAKAKAEINSLAEQITSEPIRQSYLTIPTNAILLATGEESLTDQLMDNKSNSVKGILRLAVPVYHEERLTDDQATNQAATYPSLPSPALTLSH